MLLPVRTLRLQRTPNTQDSGSLFMLALANSRLRKVKEPVDRIYALLGLDDTPDRYYHRGITIDYSEVVKKNPAKLYTQLSKLSLIREHRLYLLALAASENRLEELPS